MRHAAQTVEQAPVNNALLNVVTPMGLSFEKNRLSIGENIGKAADRLIRRDAEKRHKHWPDDRGGAHARKASADACARARQKADEDFD